MRTFLPDWVTVELLPPRTTAVIQPLDGGIIARFKRLYRKYILERLLAEGEADEHLTVDKFMKSVNILHAIQMADLAWANIPAEEIQKVWRRTLFMRAPKMEDGGELEDVTNLLHNLSLNPRFRRLVTENGVINVNASSNGSGSSDINEEDLCRLMDSWVAIDEGAVEREDEELTIDGAVDLVKGGRGMGGDDNDDEGPGVDQDAEPDYEVISHSAALQSVIELARYFEKYSQDFRPAAFLRNLISDIDVIRNRNLRQTSMNDFLLPMREHHLSTSLLESSSGAAVGTSGEEPPSQS